jgi:hypothetical protein
MARFYRVCFIHCDVSIDLAFGTLHPLRRIAAAAGV